MGNYYAAVDLGASGGRLIAGCVKEGRIILEEIHRFENGMVRKDGSLCWDYQHLFTQILEGLKKGRLVLKDETTGAEIPVVCSLTERQADILAAGGLLNYTREGGK